MTATVAQLGARALRKLGVAIVANAGRPGAGPVSTAADVAGQAVREMGVVVPESLRPDLAAVVTPDDMAARTMRAVGLNPIAGTSAPAAPVPDAEIAARALLMLGVNPQGPAVGGASGTVALSDMAMRALYKLGVNDAVEAPNPLDAALAASVVGDVHQDLVQSGIAAWDVNAVPAAAAEWYVVMAAHLLAPAFGKPSTLEFYAAAREALRVQALSGTVALARAMTRLGAVQADLAASGLADWVPGATSSEAAEHVVMLLAYRLAPVHGKPMPMDVVVTADAALRRIALSGAKGQALALAKVRAVQDALAAAGLVPWALAAVPQAFAEDYVTMAAVLLAPVMGKQAAPDRQVDQAAWDAAEGRIRRGVSIRGIYDRALARVQAVQAEVNALGLATWDADRIPASLTDAYAGMVADLLGPSMGKERDYKAYGAGMARIRMVAMGGPAGQALAEQKVRAVHAEWDARGYVPWSLFDMPDQAEEIYVLKAAYLLAPEVDAKADPAWLPMAEMGIARITAVPSRRRPVVACYF